MSRRGFTLIEMLVVVIIIGALIAIGLPQYYRTVYRSRNVQLKEAVATVASAQRAYHLKYGKYAADFKELEISMPGFSSVKTGINSLEPTCSLVTPGNESIIRSDDVYIVLNGKSTELSTLLGVISVYSKGPYKCAGIKILIGTHPIQERDTMYCSELSKITNKGSFCKKIETTKSLVSSASGNYHYSY